MVPHQFGFETSKQRDYKGFKMQQRPQTAKPRVEAVTTHMPTGHYNTGYKQQFVEKGYRIPEVDLIPYPWEKILCLLSLCQLVESLFLPLNGLMWLGYLFEMRRLADIRCFPLHRIQPLMIPRRRACICWRRFLDQTLWHFPFLPAQDSFLWSHLLVMRVLVVKVGGLELGLRISHHLRWALLRTHSFYKKVSGEVNLQCWERFRKEWDWVC